MQIAVSSRSVHVSAQTEVIQVSSPSGFSLNEMGGNPPVSE